MPGVSNRCTHSGSKVARNPRELHRFQSSSGPTTAHHGHHYEIEQHISPTGKIEGAVCREAKRRAPESNLLIAKRHDDETASHHKWKSEKEDIEEHDRGAGYD